MLKLVHANKRLKVIIFRKGGKQVITSPTKNFKNEKGRDGEKAKKQDGMPM